jgi:N-acetylglucosaminyldiphosphoundecaprenol N-acetyl-beta-D-mannosaminyltransferase
MPTGKVNILGVQISAANLQTSAERINASIRSRTPTYVCVTGVHGIMECRRDPRLLAIHNNAGMVAPDGMPLVYLCRLAGFEKSGRVYGPDLMDEICRQSLGSGYRHFLYGTTPETLTELSKRLSLKYPGLEIAGSYAPPFRPLSDEESLEIAARINETNADIVWVGLSTPKQERWMAAHRSLLEAPVLIGVGAAFDFHAGKVRQAPRWIQPLCLEWLFRLAVEPRRLWRRYLYNNPRFLAELLMQWLHLRHYGSL